MGRFLVDADDAVPGLIQEGDDLAPAIRVVPVFALGRTLYGYADIRLGERPAVIVQQYARRLLGWIDAQDVAGSAVQSDMTEVAGLKDVILVESPDEEA